MSPRTGDPGDEGEGHRRGSRKAGGSRGGKANDDYRVRRDRNNQAVRRSRVRSKLRTQETLERVRALKAENEALEDRIQALGKELGVLTELFMAHTGSSSTPNMSSVDLEALLRDNPEDELLKSTSTGNVKRERNDFKAESAADSDEDSEAPGSF
ncbi:hypothetical protein J437_LFUL012645 [Ladona fulva]|uniref:BZIP domain-containing protein n=1 Tax=Ladona fulva TaxID=123851 RepID=A0A8K0KF23_LADFU|nr:hypothetical protein J437_LFUL012645 [Ladona fulva]